MDTEQHALDFDKIDWKSLPWKCGAVTEWSITVSNVKTAALILRRPEEEMHLVDHRWRGV
jgi:hypothetical protein